MELFTRQRRHDRVAFDDFDATITQQQVRKARREQLRAQQRKLNAPAQTKAPRQSLAQISAVDAATQFMQTRSATDADALIYNVRFDRDGWFGEARALDFCPGRLTEAARQAWGTLFDAYVRYRTEIKGYEATHPVETALRTLADYLDVALPVALFRLGEIALHAPRCPREFTRFPFVDARDQSGARVPTLLEYVGRRVNGDSIYTHLNQIRLFFVFVAANYGTEQDVHIAGLMPPLIPL